MMPVVASMVATAVLLLLHVPPDAVSVSVAVEPVQTVVLPAMALAIDMGLTVTVLDATAVPHELVTE